VLWKNSAISTTSILCGPKNASLYLERADCAALRMEYVYLRMKAVVFLAITFVWLEGAFAEQANLFGLSNNAVFANLGRRGLLNLIANANNNSNRFQETGFTNLLRNGNNFFERNDLGVIRRLVIDGGGNLLGATQSNTIRQLREFLLQNANDPNLLNNRANQRFLFRNGGFNLGRFAVDLGNSVTPKIKGMEGKDMQVKLAALNFMLNMGSSSPVLMRVLPQNVRAGLVGLNLGGFWNIGGLNSLLNGNPYACGRNVPARADWLMTRFLDENVYSAVKNQAATCQEMANRYGVQFDQRRILGNKVVVGSGIPGKRDSIVSRGNPVDGERVIGVQRTLRNAIGGYWFQSDDPRENPAPGGQADGQNFFRHPLNYTAFAHEVIVNQPNGFQEYILCNQEGKRVGAAPAEVAINSNGQGGTIPSVRSPEGCVNCHTTWGIRMGTVAAENRAYTDTLGRIPGFARAFYTSIGRYRLAANRATNIYYSSLARSGAYIPDQENAQTRGRPIALVGKMAEEYRKPLDQAQAERELGAAPGSLARFFGSGQIKMDRSAFESAYCGLRANLPRLVPSTGAPQNALVRGGQQQHNGNLGTSNRPIAQ